MPENEILAQLPATRKNGKEKFHHNSEELDSPLIDFWRWSASDLLNNTIRGVLAEYIVACAVGVADKVRSPWESYDLETPSGVRIEVKSSAYLQSWYQKKLSPITFNIRPTRNWNATTNVMEDDIKRQADVYVFCVLNNKDQLTVDPLNLEQWDFYILLASVLNDQFPKQKTISLSSLLKLNLHTTEYGDISDFIEKLWQEEK